MPSPVTTRVIDLANGKPVSGIQVTLEQELGAGRWKQIGTGRTQDDGWYGGLVPHGVRLERGLYRLTFEVASYFRRINLNSLYPYISITFEVREPEGTYHLPLHLGPFGFFTGRG